MPHIAVKVNMLIDIDVELVSEYRWAKVMSCKFVTRKHNAKFDHSTIHRFLYINVVVILSTSYVYFNCYMRHWADSAFVRT